MDLVVSVMMGCSFWLSSATVNKYNTYVLAILRKLLTVWTVQQAAVFCITKVADKNKQHWKDNGLGTKSADE